MLLCRLDAASHAECVQVPEVEIALTHVSAAAPWPPAVQHVIGTGLTESYRQQEAGAHLAFWALWKPVETTEMTQSATAPSSSGS